MHMRSVAGLKHARSDFLCSSFFRKAVLTFFISFSQWKQVDTNWERLACSVVQQFISEEQRVDVKYAFRALRVSHFSAFLLLCIQQCSVLIPQSTVATSNHRSQCANTVAKASFSKHGSGEAEDFVVSVAVVLIVLSIKRNKNLCFRVWRMWYWRRRAQRFPLCLKWVACEDAVPHFRGFTPYRWRKDVRWARES